MKTKTTYILLVLLAICACKQEEFKYYPQGSIIATIHSSDSMFMTANPDSALFLGQSYARTKTLLYVYNGKYSNNLASLVIFSDSNRWYDYKVQRNNYQYTRLDTIQFNPLVFDTIRIDTFRIDTLRFDTTYIGVSYKHNGTLVHYDTGYATARKPFVTWWALP